jgi:hypothetical protein
LLLLLHFLPQDHVVSPPESRTSGLACTPRDRYPMVSSQRSEGTTSNPSVAKVSSKYSRTTLVKCAGAPSCWNHISQRTSKGTSSNSSVKLPWRNGR